MLSIRQRQRCSTAGRMVVLVEERGGSVTIASGWGTTGEDSGLQSGIGRLKSLIVDGPIVMTVSRRSTTQIVSFIYFDGSKDSQRIE